MNKNNTANSGSIPPGTEATIALDFPYDSDMPSPDLDGVKLTPKEFNRGLIRFIIFSIIGIVVFFMSVPINGKDTVVFGFLYNSFLNLFGRFIYWILFLIIGGNFVLHVYYKYIKKRTGTSAMARIYENDGIAQTVLYLLGAIYSFLYAMTDWSPAFQGIEMITGANTGGSVFPPIVKGVLGIILQESRANGFLRWC